MTGYARPPRLTPDGKPQEERRTGDETGRSSVDEAQDPAGDTDEGTYANTDEAVPDEDGLVGRGDQRNPPLI
ncbi:hypothetical protein [Mesorhizobium sp. CN2-181]|uniref:hypothetical protein n=1 Tax=Mesorhizobium yinganensis TaxID=3157707 RepID=UPI0032B86B75